MQCWKPKKKINYISILLHMYAGRYAKACSGMLYNLDLAGRTTWATKVKHVLGNLGLRLAWLHQVVGDVPSFLVCVKQRLRDISLQTWNSDLFNSDRLCSYIRCKTLVQLEDYLSCIKNKKQLMGYTQFRCGNHHLAIT
jgi:hypothetical protein